MNSIVTGGAGFIGSNLCKMLIEELSEHTCVIDKLTYAGHLESLDSVIKNSLFSFERTDINETKTVLDIFNKIKPDTIYHLAAESHVDRSIDNPNDFVITNVLGTNSILQASLSYWKSLDLDKKNKFRIVIVSTDEVYGSIESPLLFSESSNYSPNSPYSASKASSDLFAQAYYKTYGLPLIVTNCSNNYGPQQCPEKFIPLCILKALKNEAIPIYGDGNQVRDWIHVDDHNRALIQIARAGTVGSSYCIGSNNEKKNIDIANTICEIIDEIKNSKSSCKKNIVHVPDRPGHDVRYAIDASRLNNLGWFSKVDFDSGIKKTVNWYLNNLSWIEKITSKNQSILERQGNISNG